MDGHLVETTKMMNVYEEFCAPEVDTIVESLSWSSKGQTQTVQLDIREMLLRWQQIFPWGDVQEGELKWPWNRCPLLLIHPPVRACRHNNTERFNFSTCPVSASGSPPGTWPASTASLRRGGTRHVSWPWNMEGQVIENFLLIQSTNVLFQSLCRGGDNRWGSEMKIDLWWSAFFFPVVRDSTNISTNPKYSVYSCKHP